MSKIRNNLIFVPRVYIFPIIYFCILIFNLFINHQSEGTLNWYVSIVWTLFFPIAVIGLIGALKTVNLRPSVYNGLTKNKVIFLVPTIGRIENLESLYRVIDSILIHAPNNLLNFRIDIVTEEVSSGNYYISQKYRNNDKINLIIVPKEFKTPKNTKYKARANQYALMQRRENDENLNDIWVYHLDDDTSVRKDTISSIARTVNEDDGSYHLAQGILTFPYKYSSSIITRLADSIRPIDDLTKFYFFTKVLKTPLAGLHGEHLLIRSSIEDSIGWDFGPTAVTEDAEFALNFAKQFPRKSTFLNSASYGASPESISDLIKQRRRWAKGLIDLVFRKNVPFIYKLPIFYMVINWVTGFFQNIIFVIFVMVITNQNSTSPVWDFLLYIWAFNFAYQIWLYIEGLRINLSVSDKQHYFIFLAPIMIMGMFLFSFLEAFATLLGLMDTIFKRPGFVVINKPV